MNEIKNNHDNRDVLFVTDSDSRYVSSWLNMFRDDFGFLDFPPKKTNRKINYNPLNITKDELEKNITKYTKADPYLKRFNTLI